MSSTGLKTLLSVCALTFLTTPLLAQAKASGDFDGDGFDDVAIGVPSEDNGSIANCGAVHVLYGETPSITSTGNDLFFQSTVGLSDEAGDQFGFSLAAGDFNGDGFDDLAIGAAYEDVTVTDQGAVVVLYGSATGLVVTGMQFLIYVTGIAAASDRYGYSLTAANFTSLTGYEELAIGIPYRDVNGQVDAGEVEWRLGGSGGLTTATRLNQDTTGVPGTSEAGDSFGFSLTSGNFDDDTDNDLAVGVPYEDSGAINVGYVNVFNGRASGLTPSVAFFDTCAATGGAEASDLFGRSLAGGDFGGDGDDDLAVGKAHEDLPSGDSDAGEVNIHYGSSTGLAASAANCWNQDTSGVPGGAETGDMMGWALVSANFNGDAYQDLAIGCPTEDINPGANQGYVIVLYGTANTLSATGSTALGDTACDGGTEENDQFGFDLSAGDVNGSGSADLIVSIPFEDIGLETNAGAVNVRYAVIGTNQCWSQNSAGIPNAAEVSDAFGRAVAH